MQNTLAIVHAPGVKENQKRLLVNKLQRFMESMGQENSLIRLNPKLSDIKNFDSFEWRTLVVGWGHPSRPEWYRWIQENNFVENAQEIFAIDLFERRRADGRVLPEPRVNAGQYWSTKISQGHYRLFIEGYYLKAMDPYGMKRIPKRGSGNMSNQGRLHYVLAPGDPEAIEIVRLIFNMYVYDDYKRTEISNLLNSQGVAPPGRSSIWNVKSVRTLLEDPVYIGANRYSGSIRYDVFPALIDKPTYYSAQAKILKSQHINNLSSPPKKKETR